MRLQSEFKVKKKPERRVLSDDICEMYKDLKKDTRYKTELIDTFKEHFAYGSTSRFDGLLKQKLHPTPGEYIWFDRMIRKYHEFYTGQNEDILNPDLQYAEA